MKTICVCGHAKRQHHEGKCDYVGYACNCAGYEAEKWKPGECIICGVVLDQPGKPETADCGGDCMKCMAEAGDHDCIEALK